MKIYLEIKFETIPLIPKVVSVVPFGNIFFRKEFGF
jgi:hypothetical protein